MNILVTGGAGYVGSHAVKALVEAGHIITVVDLLSNGRRKALPSAIKLAKLDLRNAVALGKVFKENNFDAVLHFASLIEAGESMKNPSLFFDNNLNCLRCVLDAMAKHGVNKIIFSSSAGVYGEPKTIPISEEAEKNPTSVYGETKLIMEKMLYWYDRIYGIKSISLRYFNAAGADESGEIGEDHRPETHLIPLVLQTALGQLSEVKIFGTDYNTPDGTCIRDYVHVTDLATAHVLALGSLSEEMRTTAYNVGSECGYSVKQVIETARKVTRREIKVVSHARRPGDSAVLVASSAKIKNELGWRPKYFSLEKIIDTAWKWHSSHPNGYGT